MTSRRTAITLVALLWAGLAARVITVWDQLPPRMASHFGASGRPDGWMSRDGFWAFTVSGLLVTVNELVIRANLARAPLDARWFWVALVSFLAFVAAWLVGLYRAFRVPARTPA